MFETFFIAIQSPSALKSNRNTKKIKPLILSAQLYFHSNKIDKYTEYNRLAALAASHYLVTNISLLLSWKNNSEILR